MIINGQCVETRFSVHQAGCVQDQLKRFVNILTWYADLFSSRHLENVERKWWKKLVTWYRVFQLHKTISKCQALWNEVVRLDRQRQVVDLGNVHLVHMSKVIPHLRLLGYWGKEELENSLLHWLVIEECLQKTLLSIQ